MSKLVICRGLPASGKTTWARKQVASALQPEYELVCRVNRDDIRKMLHNGEFIKGVTEDVVITARDALIKAALRKGWDVISDDTNLRSKNVKDLMKIAALAGAEVEFNDSFLEVSVEECIYRDTMRPVHVGQVGEEVIRDMYNKFLRKRGTLPIPELDDAPTFVALPHGGKPAMIVDIDGTTAHNNGHRGWYEYESVGKDEPKLDVIRLVQNMIRAGHSAMFVSGRNDRCREDTAEWAWEHILKGATYGSDVYPRFLKYENSSQDARHKLFMRQDGDMRRDDIIKYEIYRDYIAPEYDVQIAFDDRDQVVAMWRSIGITTLQVDYGDF